MNKLDNRQRAEILHTLGEGNSLRTTAQMAGVSRNTVEKLLRDAGEVCLDYQDKVLHDLPCKRVQCDEIWSFDLGKATNVAGAKRAPKEAGNVWTWTSIDADTKLVPCWFVGDRTMASATAFIDDLAGRLANRVRLTTDGHRPHVEAAENALADEIDYARLIKIYGTDPKAEAKKRYSSAKFIEAKCGAITGISGRKHISTSYVERQDITMRMSMPRFTRLANRFSKQIESHMHSISLHFMLYNFCRNHKSLNVTPAMEAGIAKSIYDLGFIVRLIDGSELEAKKRGGYKKRFSN